MTHRSTRACTVVLGALCAASTLAIALYLDRVAEAAPRPVAPSLPDAAGPPTTLKAMPTVRRVRFEVSPGGAAITHELFFPKGALLVGGVASAGAADATLFVAFTGQARPLAIEATRHAVDAAGNLIDGGGTPVVIIDVAVRPPTAALVLGAAHSAGHVLRVPRGETPFGLRIRSAIPTSAGASAREVALMASLGIRGGLPLPLERIEIGALLGQSIRGARAVVCGPGADARPLTVVFPAWPSTRADAGTISPSAAKRHPDDDLCVDVLL